MILYPTRVLNNEKIYPIYRDAPILISNDGVIIDGHHRYYTNRLFGLPISFEVIELGETFYTTIDKLIFTNEPKQNEPLETILFLLNHPVIVSKDNNRYVIVLGNTRAWLQQPNIKVREIIK